MGASDDLTTGQSTFMVEMSEVADILREATEKSLLILDAVSYTHLFTRRSSATR